MSIILFFCKLNCLQSGCRSFPARRLLFSYPESTAKPSTRLPLRFIKNRSEPQKKAVAEIQRQGIECREIRLFAALVYMDFELRAVCNCFLALSVHTFMNAKSPVAAIKVRFYLFFCFIFLRSSMVFSVSIDATTAKDTTTSMHVLISFIS